MLCTIEKLGLIKKYRGTFVLTRKGQKCYSESGSDPINWKRSRVKSISQDEFLVDMVRLFGVTKVYLINDKDKK